MGLINGQLGFKKPYEWSDITLLITRRGPAFSIAHHFVDIQNPAQQYEVLPTKFCVFFTQTYTPKLNIGRENIYIYISPWKRKVLLETIIYMLNSGGGGYFFTRLSSSNSTLFDLDHTPRLWKKTQSRYQFLEISATCRVNKYHLPPKVLLKSSSTKSTFLERPKRKEILLMEEILHHLGCIKPCK